MIISKIRPASLASLLSALIDALVQDSNAVSQILKEIKSQLLKVL
jgi:alpha-D-ribose 1-methylphosphonate 5-triphosphate synthase subunit PhnG